MQGAYWYMDAYINKPSSGRFFTGAGPRSPNGFFIPLLEPGGILLLLLKPPHGGFRCEMAVVKSFQKRNGYSHFPAPTPTDTKGARSGVTRNGRDRLPLAKASA
jgi:hypothetical protein